MSGGSAHRIPTLLIDRRISAQRQLGLANPTFEVDGEFDGAECYVVRGETLRNRETTLWIEKANFHLRKVVERQEFTMEILEQLRKSTEEALGKDAARPLVEPREFSSVTTTTYYPQFDVGLNPSVFTFEPPSVNPESPED